MTYFQELTKVTTVEDEFSCMPVVLRNKDNNQINLIINEELAMRCLGDICGQYWPVELAMRCLGDICGQYWPVESAILHCISDRVYDGEMIC